MNQAYSFQTLFLEQVDDLFSAEEQIAARIPRLITVTSSGDLRENFNHYLQLVNIHIQHLNEILKEHSNGPSGVACKAMEGILDVAEGIIMHGGNSAVKDAAIIAMMQRVIHYKIALYGTARTFARHLNDNKAMDFLQKALNEEGEEDKKLTKLAEGGLFTTGINEEAYKECTITH